MKGFQEIYVEGEERDLFSIEKNWYIPHLFYCEKPWGISVILESYSSLECRGYSYVVFENCFTIWFLFIRFQCRLTPTVVLWFLFVLFSKLISNETLILRHLVIYKVSNLVLDTSIWQRMEKKQGHWPWLLPGLLPLCWPSLLLFLCSWSARLTV